MSSSKSVIVSSLTFRSLIHFEHIFVYGVKECSNFISLHVCLANFRESVGNKRGSRFPSRAQSGKDCYHPERIYFPEGGRRMIEIHRKNRVRTEKRGRARKKQLLSRNDFFSWVNNKSESWPMSILVWTLRSNEKLKLALAKAINIFSHFIGCLLIHGFLCCAVAFKLD